MSVRTYIVESLLPGGSSSSGGTLGGGDVLLDVAQHAHDGPSHTGLLPIERISTTETDTALVARPDGAGGVAFAADTSGLYFNVIAYGAVGDGTTDDTTAIQSAITAASVAGGVVYLPAGTYLISSTLTISTNGVSLMGEGKGASFILAAASLSTGNMVEIAAQYCGISGLGLKSTVLKTGGVGLYINAGHYILIEDVFFFHQYDSIKIDTSFVIRLIGLVLSSQSRHGIWIAGATPGNDFYLEDIVGDNGPAATGSGLHVTNGGAIFATSCDFIHFNNGIALVPAAGATSEWSFFEQVACDSCTSDGTRIGGAGGIVQGTTFVNCWSSSVNESGVYIGGAAGGGTVEGIAILNGKYLVAGKNGIKLESPATDIQISDNLIVANSQLSAGTYNGIYIEDFVTHLQITGNRAYNGLGRTPTQGYGLGFHSGATDYLVIDGNDFSGNLTGEILGLATVTGTHRWVGGQASDTGWNATTFLRGDGTWATPPAGTSQHILLADGHATPFAFTDLLQMDDGSDFMWSDP